MEFWRVIWGLAVMLIGTPLVLVVIGWNLYGLFRLGDMFFPRKPER